MPSLEEIVVAIAVAFVLVPFAGGVAWIARLRRKPATPPPPSAPVAAARVEETLAAARLEEHHLHIDEIEIDARADDETRAASNVAHFRSRR